MSYNVKFQTEAAYKNIKYGSNSIYNSACGPASLCNALKALGIADVSIPTMCSLAVSCGARVTGGTDMDTLLKASSGKYGFEYSSTSKNVNLLAHLKAGGVAILHAGDTYQLFSSGGHFVAAVAASGNTITVLDSYWYSGKYTSTSIRRNYVSVVQKGVIKTSLTQCGKATIDRSPSYYLISRKSVKVTEANKTIKVTTTELNVRSGAGTSYPVLGTLAYNAIVKATGITDNGWYRITYKSKTGYISSKYAEEIIEKQTNSDQEDDDMKYYKNLEDIPTYYRDAVKKLVDKGAIAGTGNGLNLSEDLCRTFTVLDKLGKLD